MENTRFPPFPSFFSLIPSLQINIKPKIQQGCSTDHLTVFWILHGLCLQNIHHAQFGAESQCKLSAPHWFTSAKPLAISRCSLWWACWSPSISVMYSAHPLWIIACKISPKIATSKDGCRRFHTTVHIVVPTAYSCSFLISLCLNACFLIKTIVRSPKKRQNLTEVWSATHNGNGKSRFSPSLIFLLAHVLDWSRQGKDPLQNTK